MVFEGNFAYPSHGERGDASTTKRVCVIATKYDLNSHPNLVPKLAQQKKFSLG